MGQPAPRKLKIDLHTHPVEALRDELHIQGIRDINKKVAERIVRAIKAAGLDGIAITEKGSFNHGWVAALQILDYFPHERLFILPGEEVAGGDQQFLHIYVPLFLRRRVPFFMDREWFLILAHPGRHHPYKAESFTDLHFDAVEQKSLQGEFAPAQLISEERKIPCLQSSDAHRLEEIGLHYTEVDYFPR
jgi:hypothetical protein